MPKLRNFPHFASGDEVEEGVPIDFGRGFLHARAADPGFVHCVARVTKIQIDLGQLHVSLDALNEVLFDVDVDAEPVCVRVNSDDYGVFWGDAMDIPNAGCGLDKNMLLSITSTSDNQINAFAIPGAISRITGLESRETHLLYILRSYHAFCDSVATRHQINALPYRQLLVNLRHDPPPLSYF